MVLQRYILSLYLILAPIYWLPFLPPTILEYIKVSLFLFFMIAYKIKFRPIVGPNGLLGVTGFVIIIILSLPGITLNNWFDYYERTIDVIVAASFVIIIYNLNKIEIDLDKVVMNSALIFSLVVFFVILSNFNILPNFTSTLNKKFLINDVGLGGVRTGWSIGIAFYVPFILLKIKNSTKKYKTILIVPLLILLISQYLVGGRSGLLSSIIIIGIFLIVYKKWKTLSIALITIFLIYSTVSIKTYGDIEKNLRFGSYLTNTNSDFSGGRFYQYRTALKNISENPISGNGIRSFSVHETGGDLHNTWLKFWYESGILLPLFFLYMIYLNIKNKLLYKRNDFVIAALLCIVTGIIISMFEPGTILGTFQNSVLFWFSFGIINDDREIRI